MRCIFAAIQFVRINQFFFIYEFFFLHFSFAIQSNTKTSHKCKFFSKTFQTTMQFVFLLITTNNFSSLLPQISKLIRFFFIFSRVYLSAHFFRSAIKQSMQSSRQFSKFLWNFDRFTVFNIFISFWKKIVFFFISISNVEKSFFWILNYSIFLICRTSVSANKSKIWIRKNKNNKIWIFFFQINEVFFFSNINEKKIQNENDFVFFLFKNVFRKSLLTFEWKKTKSKKKILWFLCVDIWIFIFCVFELCCFYIWMCFRLI